MTTKMLYKESRGLIKLLTKVIPKDITENLSIITINRALALHLKMSSSFSCIAKERMTKLAYIIFHKFDSFMNFLNSIKALTF